jgi:hypothetical protein
MTCIKYRNHRQKPTCTCNYPSYEIQHNFLVRYNKMALRNILSRVRATLDGVLNWRLEVFKTYHF